jgi:hypothetical protein
LCGNKLLACRRAERDEYRDAADASEVCVLSDRADIFLLGVRVPPTLFGFNGSRFVKTFLRLDGDGAGDRDEVGVLKRLGCMKP